MRCPYCGDILSAGGHPHKCPLGIDPLEATVSLQAPPRAMVLGDLYLVLYGNGKVAQASGSILAQRTTWP